MNIYQSIAGIMQESIAIGKDKYNEKQNFKYRGIDDVMNTFYPLLSKHNVFIVPEVLEQTREERVSKQGGNLIYSILKVKYTFFAEDGSNITAIVVGEGMDSADKASNKAMAVAMKYAMFQVFCIPTEEMPDPDAETPPQSTPKNTQGKPDTKAEKKEKTAEIPEISELTDDDIQKAYEFVIDFGKNKGKQLQELTTPSLEWYAENANNAILRAACNIVIKDRNNQSEAVIDDGDLPF